MSDKLFELAQRRSIPQPKSLQVDNCILQVALRCPCGFEGAIMPMVGITFGVMKAQCPGCQSIWRIDSIGYDVNGKDAAGNPKQWTFTLKIEQPAIVIPSNQKPF